MSDDDFDIASAETVLSALMMHIRYPQAQLHSDSREAYEYLLKKYGPSTFENIVKNIRSDNSWLVYHDEIPLDLAEKFVMSSAWWHTHSSGRPVRAPRHADRIYKSSRGWALDFGANTFLISTAIERCSIEINNALDHTTSEGDMDLHELKEKLKLHISGAVANHEGYEYEGYYPLEGNDMMFGAQSIDVDDGAQFLLDECSINEIFS